MRSNKRIKRSQTAPLLEGVTLDTRSRTRIVAGGFLLLAGLATMRLGYLQVMEHGKFASRAEAQHLAEYEIQAERGEIFLKDGNELYPLAVNKEYPMAYVSPRDVADKEMVAHKLSEVLSLDYEEVLWKLNKPNDPFEILKKKISDEEKAKLEEGDLAGVDVLPEKYRHYPGGELAAQVVGFASLDPDVKDPGYGMEAFWNSELTGKPGEVRQERDAAGRWIPLSDRQVTQVEHGDDIVLTLDKNIQHEVEKILAHRMALHRADGASAIVLDPHTGSILAMANVPTFNPNEYNKAEDYGVFLNSAVSLTYEPGSIMKPLTMAIGLENDKVTPESTYVDTGVVSIAGYDIHNAEEKTYGLSDMYKVLDESLNTGVIYVERLVGNEKFKEGMEKLGFGQKTGIDLPAELAGDIRNLDNTNKHIQFYTASFGQGITTTPLQMVMAYGALANRGVLMKPKIIDSVIKSNGEKVVIEPTEERRVFSKHTVDDIAKMLRSVVVNGHGKRADVPGYLVGGKTGTAQVAKEGSKGYEEGISIGSFVGYAPVQDPKYVVFVKIDNPRDVEWAESSAAPAFGEIMKFLLEYGHVTPTESLDQNTEKKVINPTTGQVVEKSEDILVTQEANQATGETGTSHAEATPITVSQDVSETHSIPNKE